MLYNGLPQDNDDEYRSWKHNTGIDIIKKLWTEIPSLRHLAYESEKDKVNNKRSDFEGENVLHMAIANRNITALNLFTNEIDSDPVLRKALVEGQVTGPFSTVGHHKLDFGHSAVPGCIYGQHPICWAACTFQPKVVELLLSWDADIECRTDYTETCGGDTILHMLVRQCSAKTQDSGQQLEDFKEMFDFILQRWVRHRPPSATAPAAAPNLPMLWQSENMGGWTPLMLAAAIGTKEVFDHVLRKCTRLVEWQFGPYRGLSLEIH